MASVAADSTLSNKDEKTANSQSDSNKGEVKAEPSQEKGKEENKVVTENPREQTRKKSVVDIAVIKEKDEKNSLDQKDESLEESLTKMPGMTKSASRDILKAIDDAEIKQIAADLAGADAAADEGSVIDISIVNDSDDNTATNDDGLGMQAEIIGDDEEVNISPGKNEQVVELTLEMKHFVALLSVVIGMMAAMYALVFYKM